MISVAKLCAISLLLGLTSAEKQSNVQHTVRDQVTLSMDSQILAMDTKFDMPPRTFEMVDILSGGALYQNGQCRCGSGRNAKCKC